MKRAATRSACLASIFALAAACGGESGSGSGPGDDIDEPEVEPPSGDSLKRNPSHPLKCERPITENGKTSPLARLTDDEYMNTLRDLFDGVVSKSKLPKRSDLPAEPREGLFSTNVSTQTVESNRADVYLDGALSVAGEAVKDIDGLMGCEPSKESEEADCVEGFIEDFGLRAWRRPLTDDEKEDAMNLFKSSRDEFDFETSVQSVVAGLISAPQFLYRIEKGAGKETDDSGLRLSSYEMASRLSYLLWDSMPDPELFEAAEDGKLLAPDDIEEQARRMLADDRAHEAMASFYDEWLQLDRVHARLSADKKATGDGEPYEGYGEDQANDLIESLNRFLDDAFFNGDHSMKRLFTSNRGYVSDNIADIFGVDGPGKSGFKRVDLPEDERSGLLTQPGFMGGWSHETEQAPILRGAFIMEHILCAPSPDPPDNVIPEIRDVPNREDLTYRQFVENTVQQGACKGCHEVIDGYGFLFENYDGIGAYQTKERHLDIDATGTVRGTLDLDGDYDNGIEFSKKLAQSEQAAQCIVQNYYEYAMARGRVKEDGCAIAPLTDGFIEDGMDFHTLVTRLVRSSAFRFRTTAQ